MIYRMPVAWTILGLGIALTVGAGAPNEPKPGKEKEPAKVAAPTDLETIKGQIVDLNEYFLRGAKVEPAKASPDVKSNDKTADTPQAGEKEPAKAEAPKGAKAADGAPIGLVMVEESLVRKIIPGDTVCLLVFEPGQKQAYEMARRMVGLEVKVKAKSHERGGIHALAIHQIEPTGLAKAGE